MSDPPHADLRLDRAAETTAVRPDELTVRRVRRAQSDIGAQALTDLEREDYELRLEAFERQVFDYRARIAEFASQLDLAHHDGLTGAWLRQAGRELLTKEIARAARHGTSLSIAFVDIDGLKTINDRLGHAAGDHAIITVARALIVGLRGYDHVVRWGGDDFLCVMPGVNEEEATRRLQEARDFLVAGAHHVAISVGVVERTGDETLEELVARADGVLYTSRGHHLRD